MIYAVDFDGTIHSGDDKIPPAKECIEVLKRIRQYHNKIMIYSCRANAKCVESKEIAVGKMIDYLNVYDVPYDGILHDKPLFDVCIDDRNFGTPLNEYGQVNWVEIKKMLGM